MRTHKPTISVRKAATGDAQAILQCLREAFAAFRDAYTPGAFRNTVLTLPGLADRVAKMSVFVATNASGEIVGTIAGEVVRSGEGHIRGMAVRPAWHGGDVAAELVRTVELELRNRGCSRISLDTTLPLQRAIHFYEKQGFRKSGRVTDFFGMELIECLKVLEP